MGIKQFFSTIWKYWKKIGEFIGNLLGRFFLMLFYITIVLPFGIGIRLLGDPLNMHKKATPRGWAQRHSPEPTIEASFHQF